MTYASSVCHLVGLFHLPHQSHGTAPFEDVYRRSVAPVRGRCEGRSMITSLAAFAQMECLRFFGFIPDTNTDKGQDKRIKCPLAHQADRVVHETYYFHAIACVLARSLCVGTNAASTDPRVLIWDQCDLHSCVQDVGVDPVYAFWSHGHWPSNMKRHSSH